MRKNIIEWGRPQLTKWRMRNACWVATATDSHSEYVILIVFYCNNGNANAPRCYVIVKCLSCLQIEAMWGQWNKTCSWSLASHLGGPGFHLRPLRAGFGVDKVLMGTFPFSDYTLSQTYVMIMFHGTLGKSDFTPVGISQIQFNSIQFNFVITRAGKIAKMCFELYNKRITKSASTNHNIISLNIPWYLV